MASVAALTLLAAALAMLGGCSAGTSGAVQTAPQQTERMSPPRQEEPAVALQMNRGVDAVFDPAKHRADDVRSEAEQVLRQIAPPRVDEESQATVAIDPALMDTAWVAADGYRIQIHASTTRELAEEAAERARERFPYDSVYVVFEAPWHKVRVGDAESREDAEKKLREARQKGYREAFWVPSTIRAMQLYREDEVPPEGAE